MSDSESTDSSDLSWSSDEDTDFPKKVKNKIKHFLDRSLYFYHNQKKCRRHNNVKIKSYYDPVSERYYEVYKQIR